MSCPINFLPQSPKQESWRRLGTKSKGERYNKWCHGMPWYAMGSYKVLCGRSRDVFQAVEGAGSKLDLLILIPQLSDKLIDLK